MRNMEAPFYVLLLLPLVSGFILPLTKPNGDPDLTSVVSHVTLLEQMYTSLQTQFQTSNTHLETLKEKLQTTDAELQLVKSELKAAEADIILLKDGHQNASPGKSTSGDSDVAFQVSQTQMSHSGVTTLKFDTLDYNNGNHYDSSSGHFTAPVSGTYIFWANVMFVGAEAVQTKYVYISKGGQKLATGIARLQDEDPKDYRRAWAMAVTHLDARQEVHFTLDSSHKYTLVDSSYGGALLHAT